MFEPDILLEIHIKNYLGVDKEMKSKINVSTIALIFGIVGLVLSCMCIGLPVAIVGMFLGVVALKNASDKSEKAKCIVAIVMGIFSILVIIGMFKSGIFSDKKDTATTENAETEIIEAEVIDTEISLATENVGTEENEDTENSETVVEAAMHNLNALVDEIADITIPEYSGNPYVSLNDNIPYFTDEELTTVPFELYSDVDYIGRCGVAYANICKEIMPTEERGEIGSVKPSGWHTVKYDCIDGMFLYNRCHLIGYQLAGENANTKNLITGTRYLNVEGMLPFENMVGDYVNETNNHVLYRVTPVYEENNLVASGVIIEAKSVEDNGDGILFNVYCYNVQPGISIDYLTGESTEADNTTISSIQSTTGESALVWLSATGEKYHSINNCGRMNPDNARQVTEEYAISSGFEKCGKCW